MESAYVSHGGSKKKGPETPEVNVNSNLHRRVYLNRLQWENGYYSNDGPKEIKKGLGHPEVSVN